MKLEKMNINTEEEKEVRELLENLGWNNLDDESIQELIQFLHKYNIDTKEEISAFLAQCAWETGWGKNLTELGSDEYFAGKAYGKNTEVRDIYRLRGSMGMKRLQHI